MSGQAMLRIEGALERMLDGLVPLATEAAPIDQVLGRVLAEDVLARDTLPPWDDSAMDGYAVRSVDVATASHDRPIELRVTGEVAAGHSPGTGVGSGTAQRILTGAPLPPGADAVVRVEDTDAAAGVADLPDRVGIRVAVAPGTSVRTSGSDLRAGDLVLAAGTPIRARHIAALVAAGRGTVRVHGRPRVAVLATGDELVAPGTPLDGARIPDSSSAGIAAQVVEAGATPVSLGIAGDDRETIRDRLRIGIDTSDVVVVCGGVSVGAHDEVRPALEDVGRVEVWRVAIQPGKPLTFGRADASDGRVVLLFGLPGNPVSSFVTFEVFVRPVLRRLSGRRSAGGRAIIRARIASGAAVDPARRGFLRVAVEQGPDGPVARLAGGQGSHMVSALAVANGLAVVPEGVGRVEAGTELEVIMLDDEPLSDGTHA